MATAHRREEEPVTPPPTIVLEMTEEEAKTLRYVTSHIAGSPFSSRRKYTDSIRDALDAVGFSDSREDGLIIGARIWFKDEEA